MKLHCMIMCFCLLATALYLSCPSITHSAAASPSPPSMTLLTERRIIREQQHEGRKLKVVDKEWKKVDAEGAFMGQDNENSEDGEELVYHVDYHGVSTHPPKHPRP